MPFMRLSKPPLSRITRVIVLEYLFLLDNLTVMTSTHQVSNSIKYSKSEFELNSHRKVIPPEYARIESNFPTLAF
jgi:hypothetical protein